MEQPKRSSTLFWLLIILLIAVAGGGWYYYINYVKTQPEESVETPTVKKTPKTTATPDETADWKTYTNTTYGFSLKYPNDWTKTEVNSKQDSVKIVTFTSPDTAQKIANKTASYNQEDIAISYASATTKSITNGSGTIGLWLHDKFTNATTAKKVTKETINGIVFNEAQIQADPSYFATIAVDNNGGVFAIDFSNIQNKSDMTTVEQQILSTFKFTTATADWKTYTNTKYGFSFKYPPTWELKENSGVNYDLSVASITSPETLKTIEEQKINGENYGPYAEDISFYYFPTVADETENKGNKLGATTLDELIQKNEMIKKIGNLKIGGIDAVDVILAGESSYYTILAVNNSHLYKIFFSNRQTKSGLTTTENQILSTFQFTQ